MNDVLVPTGCPNCAAAMETLEAEAQKLERIKAAARAAKSEIFGMWCGKSYDLWLEIMGDER